MRLVRHSDVPYAISVSVGALLGVGLFFLLAPRLQPHLVTPATSSLPAPSGLARIDVNNPPPAPDVAVEDRLDVPRAVVRTPVDQQWAEFRKQERRAFASRPRVNPQRQVNAPQRVQIERRVRAERPVTPRPTAGGAERVPVAAPLVSVPPAPVIAPTPNPVSSDDGPRYMIQVGPVAGEERAADIVRQLSVAGFLARLASIHEPGASSYQVVSETIPLAVAERRVAVLTQLGFRPHLRVLAGGFAQLRFGAFATQQEAEVLAERVRTTGYAFAAVVREGGTTFLITLGPHREDTVEAIQTFLRMRFRWMLPVTVHPAS